MAGAGGLCIFVVALFAFADFNWLIANGWPSDVDPRRTVLLKGAPMIPRTTEAGTVPGAARLTRYTNTEVDIDVEAPSGGILLLNDVWHPWWRATLDGKPREILKADVIFRAASVPPGRHMVRFTFRDMRLLLVYRRWSAPGALDWTNSTSSNLN